MNATDVHLVIGFNIKVPHDFTIKPRRCAQWNWRTRRCFHARNRNHWILRVLRKLAKQSRAYWIIRGDQAQRESTRITNDGTEWQTFFNRNHKHWWV